jgi:hypothetical protein
MVVSHSLEETRRSVGSKYGISFKERDENFCSSEDAPSICVTVCCLGIS